jgi:hypothetical protein
MAPLNAMQLRALSAARVEVGSKPPSAAWVTKETTMADTTNTTTVHTVEVYLERRVWTQVRDLRRGRAPVPQC